MFCSYLRVYTPRAPKPRNTTRNTQHATKRTLAVPEFNSWRKRTDFKGSVARAISRRLACYCQLLVASYTLFLRSSFVALRTRKFSRRESWNTRKNLKSNEDSHLDEPLLTSSAETSGPSMERGPSTATCRGGTWPASRTCHLVS